MNNKLDIQNRYNELKKEFDELNEFYWSLEELDTFTCMGSQTQREYKEELADEIRQVWYLIKAMNKKLYYER